MLKVAKAISMESKSKLSTADYPSLARPVVRPRRTLRGREFRVAIVLH